ncbi:MAG TPA: hypothetical protein VFQ13_04350 [Anaerolineales bacterium]|nr:hypothetical protein [Anaerolineales bacterium]
MATTIRLLNDQSNRKVYNMVPILTLLLILLLALLWLGLNYRQLYIAWATGSETQRLATLAADAPDEFQNPALVEDRFAGRLSSDFWKFTTINGGGEVSNELTWHSAAITVNDALTIQHFPDPLFTSESSARAPRGPEQYNNVSLIGGSGFRPSKTKDVVLQFSARASEKFYGTGGVIFQPVGTLQKDGFFAKPFDMFGFSVVGPESSFRGVTGPLCYLALKSIPSQVKSLQVDAQSLHTYEIRLRWIERTKWLGTVKVDDEVQCQIDMPAFGPVEVHVWSDNALVLHEPRRWWEFGSAMDFKCQDGGEKQFSLGMIQIFEEAR